jgi:thiosulfate reductase cytochrome b subunit
MRIKKKHPLVIRWAHWVNFPVLGVMIWSGILIYWAYGVYRIGWGDTTVLKFFPKSFYQALHIPYRLAEGMAFHFAFMWLFAVNGLVYVAYTILSGGWRLLLPRRKDWPDAYRVLLHDLHIRKTVPSIDGKYNAAQRIAYTAIVLMGIGSLMTGVAIYKPVQFGWLCTMFGGYAAARIIHFGLTIGYCLFFLIHVIQVVVTGWNNFRGMVTGFEVVEDEGNDAQSAAITVPVLPVELPDDPSSHVE